MTTVAVPEMRRNGYAASLAAGSAAVGGTLGILIPPSAVLVLYGVLTEESIGQLLLAGVVPGLGITLMLMVTTYILVRRNPSLISGHDAAPNITHLHAIRLLWPVPVIFGFSMGGLYLGVFTVTESGAAGAFLALAYGILTRRVRMRELRGAISETVRLTAVVFLLLVAGQSFGYLMAITRIPNSVGELIGGLDVAAWMVIAVLSVFYMILGALMDEMAILVVLTPIVYPVVTGLGYDGVWFGVLTIILLMTGMLTPPVGLVAFIVAGISGIPSGTVFRGLIPYLATLLLAIGLVVAFPLIVTWLPGRML
jgi:tripartite ATP-independent transporter DctM subunit